MRHIFQCQQCGRYTMKETCSCGGNAVNPKPPKYSPEDKYGSYRRKAKEQELREKKLL
ncbi:RNA-protein complex protein Nop10 [Candidatus Woesearchaeota archaeon]|nr:RNA-protein complex protein Nop10 [Candidatus Woesearchaeota archaeon]